MVSTALNRKRKDGIFISSAFRITILRPLKGTVPHASTPFVYVFTHELVHIVRFCNFFQMFDVPEKKGSKKKRLSTRPPLKF